MLARFATGASFSTDSKGGGRESNARFLPFMIQMASHLLHHGGSNQQQQRQALVKLLTAYLSSPSSSSSSSPSRSSSVGSSDEKIQFMMVNSLLSESYESWSEHRLSFLQRGIYHAYMQHRHGKPSSPPLRPSDPPSSVSTDLDDDSAKLFPIIQPMLVYAGLIERLQRFLKPTKGSTKMESPEGDGDGDGDGEAEGWEVVMKERLMSVKEMVGFSKDLLSFLEEMNSAVDLQEAFDVMGALGDVLSAGFSSCQDFVLAAISSGTS